MLQLVKLREMLERMRFNGGNQITAKISVQNDMIRYMR